MKEIQKVEGQRAQLEVTVAVKGMDVFFFGAGMKILGG